MILSFCHGTLVFRHLTGLFPFAFQEAYFGLVCVNKLHWASKCVLTEPDTTTDFTGPYWVWDRWGSSVHYLVYGICSESSSRDFNDLFFRFWSNRNISGSLTSLGTLIHIYNAYLPPIFNSCNHHSITLISCINFV